MTRALRFTLPNTKATRDIIMGLALKRKHKTGPFRAPVNGFHRAKLYSINIKGNC